jgi:hippurate hydrolase
VVIASQIVLAVQTIVSRSTDPVDKALISITKINGGTAYNVIDDSVKLGGTIRTFKPETRSFFEKKLKEISSGIAKANGAEAEVDFHLTNKYPPTINSKKESEFAANVAKKVFGDSQVDTDIDPSMGGEDFSYLLEKKPGAYLYIGQGDDNHKAHLHTTKYDFNDNLLPVGVNYWVELVKEFFSK